MTGRLNTRFLVSAVALEGIGNTLWTLGWCVHCDSGERTPAVCSCSMLNQCGHVAVSPCQVIPNTHSSVILEQVHMKMLWFGRPPHLSSSLLAVIVIHSALFMQLESSPGLPQRSTSPNPKVSRRQFSEIFGLPCAASRLSEVWGVCWSHLFSLELEVKLVSFAIEPFQIF